MRLFLAARAIIGEVRFIDIRNDEVVNAPVETFGQFRQQVAVHAVQLECFGLVNALAGELPNDLR